MAQTSAALSAALQSSCSFEEFMNIECTALVRQLSLRQQLKIDIEQGNETDRVIEFTIRASSEHSISGLSIFEDLFDYLTISECVQAFGKFETLLGNTVFTEQRAGLPFLRICNRLLGRLSRTGDAIFRGRVLFLMATSLPLDERSGVNVKNAFNCENLTYVEENPDIIEAAFYKQLWGLQNYFKNPVTLSTKFGEFTASLEAVLSAFELYKGSEKHIKSLDAGYYPKYLTSAHLMKLQLSDPEFRSHILLQCLILFQLLEGDCKKVVVQLSESDKSVVAQFRSRVVLLIRSVSGDNSESFYKEVQTHLTHEEVWIAWKENSCKPEIEKPGFVFGDPVVSTWTPPVIELGTKSDLECLWSISEDNLSLLKEKHRNFIPTMKSQLDRLIEEEEDSDSDEDMMSKNDELYAWKFLRMVQKRDIHQFQKSEGRVMPIVQEEINARNSENPPKKRKIRLEICDIFRNGCLQHRMLERGRTILYWMKVNIWPQLMYYLPILMKALKRGILALQKASIPPAMIALVPLLFVPFLMLVETMGNVRNSPLGRQMVTVNLIFWSHGPMSLDNLIFVYAVLGFFTGAFLFIGLAYQILVVRRIRATGWSDRARREAILTAQQKLAKFKDVSSSITADYPLSDLINNSVAFGNVQDSLRPHSAYASR